MSYAQASRDYENREPRESEAWRMYKETLTEDEQSIVCKEYLDHVKGWDRYDEWAELLNIHVQSVGIRSYCEGLDSFLDFIEAGAS